MDQPPWLTGAALLLLLLVQVMDNGLLCHQACLAVNPILEAEATAPNAPGALQYLYSASKDLLEKPSVWIVVGTAARSRGSVEATCIYSSLQIVAKVVCRSSMAGPLAF